MAKRNNQTVYSKHAVVGIGLPLKCSNMIIQTMKLVQMLDRSPCRGYGNGGSFTLIVSMPSLGAVPMGLMKRCVHACIVHSVSVQD